VVGLLLGVDVPDGTGRRGRRSAVFSSFEQVAGGSSLVGTYHRTRGVQRWGQAVQQDRDPHGMDTTRRPVSETEDSRQLGRRA
jgi:hypothetical protein